MKRVTVRMDAGPQRGLVTEVAAEEPIAVHDLVAVTRDGNVRRAEQGGTQVVGHVVQVHQDGTATVELTPTAVELPLGWAEAEAKNFGNVKAFCRVDRAAAVWWSHTGRETWDWGLPNKDDAFSRASSAQDSGRAMAAADERLGYPACAPVGWEFIKPDLYARGYLGGDGQVCVWQWGDRIWVVGLRGGRDIGSSRIGESHYYPSGDHRGPRAWVEAFAAGERLLAELHQGLENPLDFGPALALLDGFGKKNAGG